MDTGTYILGGIAVLALILFAIYRVQVVKFFGETWVELAKCSWPWDPNQTGLKKYKELLESTGVVIVSTIFLACFVTTSDLLLAHVVGALTGGGIVK